MTAKSRSTIHLSGTTQLTPAEVLTVVREGAALTKGGGASLLTTGIWNIGAQIVVVQAEKSSLALALTSGKGLVELCTFGARAVCADASRTQLTVGGLETYKTQQKKLWYLIPVGPKMIPGMAPYKKFLTTVAQRITESDATSDMRIAQDA